MGTRAPTSRGSAPVGRCWVGVVALLGCAPIPTPTDAGSRARPVVDVPPPPRDVPVDRPPVDAGPPPNPRLADLPPIPSGGAPPGWHLRRRIFPRPWASYWTDNAALRRLTASCYFRPVAPDAGVGGDPLHCATDIEVQPLHLDPCFDEVNLPCRRTCGSGCNTCDAACRADCSQCRVDCRGLPCLQACAARCGRCLQGCIDARDHCLTAGCAARHRVCLERLIQRYRGGGCADECLRCYRECSTVERGSGCFAACLNRSTHCDAEGRMLCEDGGPGYGAAE